MAFKLWQRKKKLTVQSKTRLSCLMNSTEAATESFLNFAIFSGAMTWGWSQACKRKLCLLPTTNAILQLVKQASAGVWYNDEAIDQRSPNNSPVTILWVQNISLWIIKTISKHEPPSHSMIWRSFFDASHLITSFSFRFHHDPEKCLWSSKIFWLQKQFPQVRGQHEEHLAEAARRSPDQVEKQE